MEKEEIEEIIEMIKELKPFGNYGYNECVISCKDLDKLIKRIEEYYG